MSLIVQNPKKSASITSGTQCVNLILVPMIRRFLGKRQLIHFLLVLIPLGDEIWGFSFLEKAHFCGHKCTLLAFGAPGDNDWRNPDRPKDSEKGFLFHGLLQTYVPFYQTNHNQQKLFTSLWALEG